MSGVDEALQVGVVLIPAKAVGPVGLEPGAAGGRRGTLPRERARTRAQLHHVARRQRREVGRGVAGEEAHHHRDEEEDGRPHPDDRRWGFRWTGTGRPREVVRSYSVQWAELLAAFVGRRPVAV